MIASLSSDVHTTKSRGPSLEPRSGIVDTQYPDVLAWSHQNRRRRVRYTIQMKVALYLSVSSGVSVTYIGYLVYNTMYYVLVC